METTLTAIGNSTGMRLPGELLSGMNLKKGDKVYIVPGKDGFLVTPYDPEFAEDMKAVKKFMKDYKNALRELAQ
jgi:putative addiction module antidote